MHTGVNKDVKYVQIGDSPGSANLSQRVRRWFGADSRRSERAGGLWTSREIGEPIHCEDSVLSWCAAQLTRKHRIPPLTRKVRRGLTA
jgi:hypothetical protein